MDVQRVGEKIGTGRQWLKEFYSELAGTCLFVFVGSCTVAQKVLTSPAKGTWLSIHLGYGFAIGLGILVANPSGAHLNPAVTLGLCVIGKKPWKACLHYFPAQYLGAFIGAALCYLVYIDALYDFDDGNRHVTGPLGTAGIFTTYPADYLSYIGGVVDQVLSTFVLMFVLCALLDEHAWNVPPYLLPLYIAIIIITIGCGFLPNCGYPVNPARDLGPRIFVTIAGWGLEAFTHRNYWWIPILGPHIGAILGALFYVFLVEMHHHSKGAEE